MTVDRERPAHTAPETPAILVVADDDDTADTLRSAGLDVTRVSAEDEATAEFDCLVVVADGVGVLDRLDSTHSAVPVVFVGGDETTAPAAFEAGADEFVPAANATEPAVLAARVRGVVARRTNALLEADLARERSLLDAIFETVPAHLYVKDAAGRHLRVSEAYVDDTERFLGKTDRELMQNRHTDQTYDDDRRVIESGEPMLHKEERVDGLDLPGFSVQYLLSEHGEETEAAESWVLTSKVPWRDDDGTVLGLVGFTIDISERNEYRQRLERQNERLAEFAGIVSHDLRSPLNVAQGYLDLLESSVESEEARDSFERVEQAHRRMNSLIEDVLALARQGEVVDGTEPTRVGDAATEAWQTAVPDGEATLSVETGDLTVDADRSRLSELFDNLFANAVDHAVADGDPPRVRVGALGEGFFVEDDGPGVPPSDRETVFETGHTTDPDGTGFGLAIVRRIAEAHGWTVTLTEGAGGGARFEFRVDDGDEPVERAGSVESAADVDRTESE